MGGCASKPKDLDSKEAPAPVEAPAPAEAPVAAETAAAPAEVEAEAVPVENKDGNEKKEEPLVDLSEPAREAPNEETAATEAVSVEEKKEEATEEAAPKTEN
ncbi:uncharacterized protein LOC142524937 [Primulina tabacum]|uniref:uncharacterized protein LOC142524937 n=1 Tax=Primulina tabacum TaxID=48773 RepID=UPI003F590E7E